LGEIEAALAVLETAGTNRAQITVLHCTTEYPAPMAEVNLRAMQTIAQKFGVKIGYSDHTQGIEVSIAAAAMGAAVIEKHFTLARSDGGVDSAFSLEPAELAALVHETERAWQSLGEVRYGPTEAERASLQFRRSIYVSAEIAEGDLFTPENLRVVRPGHGAPPHLYDQLLGRPARRAYQPGTPLSMDQLL